MVERWGWWWGAWPQQGKLWRVVLTWAGGQWLAPRGAPRVTACHVPAHDVFSDDLFILLHAQAVTLAAVESCAASGEPSCVWSGERPLPQQC